MGTIGKRIGFIGAGQMGSALIRGFLEKGLFTQDEICASDPSEDRRSFMKKECGVRVFSSNKDTMKRSDIVLLAVKPQVMEQVLRDIKEHLEGRHLICSIAAGVTTEFIESRLIDGVRVVRVMPNTPSLIHQGAAAICKGTHATDHDLAICVEMFESVGIAVGVPEALMDAVTGLSGSGPAYCFRFVEALTEGGVMEGLPREVAQRLAVQTVIGAAILVSSSSKHPAELEAMVTSPGGTTIQGLFALEKNGFSGAVMEAVSRATKRSRELGKSLK